MVFVTHDVREGLLLGTHIGLMLQVGSRSRTPDEFRRSDNRNAGRSWPRHESVELLRA